MKVRLVEVGDAPALALIYNPEVLETTNTFDLVARGLDEQVEWIEAHWAVHPCLVAVNEDDDLGEAGARGELILGFAVASPFRDRPAYATTVESSVYVLRAARGRGVGERLLRELVDTARVVGFHCLIARIVGENEGSIRLHEKCGFTLVGTEIEVGRKHGQWLDVVEYQYVVDSPD
jgi:L-amino acid N-acyltransferase YncA